MEVVGRAHGVQNDVGEYAVVKPFQLNVIAERRQVAIERGAAHLPTAPPLPGGAALAALRMRELLRHLHRPSALPAVAAVVVSPDGEMLLRLRCRQFRRRRLHNIHIGELIGRYGRNLQWRILGNGGLIACDLQNLVQRF